MKNRFLIVLLLAVLVIGLECISYSFDLLNTPSDIAVMVGWGAISTVFVIFPTLLILIFKRILKNYKTSKETK